MTDLRRTIEVPATQSGERLDVFLTNHLVATGEPVSRSQIQKLITAGSVTLNGKPAKARDKLTAGDVVTVEGRLAAPSLLTPVSMPLAILFEDEHVIVINKPAGLAVHPGAGTTEPTLVQGLLFHCGQLGKATPFKSATADEDTDAPASLAVQRPGIVHRLDKDTSGVLVCAKTDQAHAHLARQFHDKTNRREYLALLDGVLTTVLTAPLDHESYLSRDPAYRTRFVATAKPPGYPEPARGYRYARSIFKAEAVFGNRLMLARVTLRTGRTHQIRVHAKELGAPVWGDQLYARTHQLPLTFALPVRERLGAVRRQLLHASLLGFMHPVTQRELLFEAPYPDDFRDVLAALEPYRQVRTPSAERPP